MRPAMHGNAEDGSSLPESLNADGMQRLGRDRLEKVLRQVQHGPDADVERQEIRHAAQTQERTDDRRLRVVDGPRDALLVGSVSSSASLSRLRLVARPVQWHGCGVGHTYVYKHTTLI